MIYLTLFLEFFKIGLFCFGGGFGMLPLIEETVVAHGWMDAAQFYEFVGVCESTPGPIAVNTATYVGATQGDFLGSVCAVLGTVLPSFLIILLIASLLRSFTENRFFKGFIRGVKPVVIALILSTGTILLANVVGFTDMNEFDFSWVSAVIFLVIAGLFYGVKHFCGKKLSSIWLILISAVLGVGLCLLESVL